MFATVLTVVLGLAAAGGLALYNSMSRSFRGVTDLADGKRWSRAISGAATGTPHRSSPLSSSSAEQRSSSAEQRSSWASRDHHGPQKRHKTKRSGRKVAKGKAKKDRKKASRTARKQSKHKKKLAKIKNHKGGGKKTVAHRSGHGQQR